MKKPEPHELAGARALARMHYVCPWSKMSDSVHEEIIQDVRGILRAAGRGGKELSRRIVFDPECECSCEPKSWLDGHPPCHGTCRRVLILDCGPARKKGGRK